MLVPNGRLAGCAAGQRKPCTIRLAYLALMVIHSQELSSQGTS